MGWDAKFSAPILLPKGKKLVTLRDAALYITKLPKAEHEAAEWQAAMEALILVAELGERVAAQAKFPWLCGAVPLSSPA